MVAGAAEGFEVVRSIVETPEHQCRLKRNGGKGIDGEAYGVAVGINRGNDGDTGGKAPKGTAQGAAVGLLLGHRKFAARKRPYYPHSPVARRE